MKEFERARLLIVQGRFAQAEEVLQKGLREDPENAIAYSTLSHCQRETDQLKAALASAQKGVALAPESGYAYYQLAWTHHDLKQFRLMLEAVRSLMAIDPASADAYCLEAVYWANRERAERMLESAEKGLACDPSHLQCQLLRVRGLIAVWRWDEAMEDIHRIFQQAPNNTHVFAARGWIHCLKGRRESALRDFKEALRLEPDNDWAKKGLVRVLKDQNPLNVMHYVNPYGRALFTSGQVRANYWITAAPFVLVVAVGVALIVKKWFVLSGAIALFFISYLATSAVSAETPQDRNRFLAAVGLAVVGAMALILAPNHLQETVLFCLSAAASILAYLCVKDWEALNKAFRLLFVGAGGLAGLGAITLLLAFILPVTLSSAAASVGIVLSKLAIALFVTSAIGQIQFR